MTERKPSCHVRGLTGASMDAHAAQPSRGRAAVGMGRPGGVQARRGLGQGNRRYRKVVSHRAPPTARGSLPGIHEGRALWALWL